LSWKTEKRRRNLENYKNIENDDKYGFAYPSMTFVKDFVLLTYYVYDDTTSYIDLKLKNSQSVGFAENSMRRTTSIRTAEGTTAHLHLFFSASWRRTSICNCALLTELHQQCSICYPMIEQGVIHIWLMNWWLGSRIRELSASLREDGAGSRMHVFIASGGNTVWCDRTVH
jgi:hypothetical protein